jgi:transglutaminase-like putative cysteine protease
MRLLTVRHVTIYRYAEPVGLGEHRMMFRPRESHDLRLIGERLTIRPKPVHLRWLHDVFDNSVAIANFSSMSTELHFDSTVTLEHIETALPDYPLELYARTYPFRYAPDELPDLVRGLDRHYTGEAIEHWVTGFIAQCGTTDTMDLLRAMTRRVKELLVYRRRDEKGVQNPTETLQSGEGSCRDFAVFMMEAVRFLGLAARFVSGYIFVPDAAPATTVGGGATHAWLQVYLPGAGWVDFDPTNSIVGNRNLIRVAVAWGPEQVLPLWGSFIGLPSSYRGMEVAVSVSETRSPDLLAVYRTAPTSVDEELALDRSDKRYPDEWTSGRRRDLGTSRSARLGGACIHDGGDQGRGPDR